METESGIAVTFSPSTVKTTKMTVVINGKSVKLPVTVMDGITQPYLQGLRIEHDTSPVGSPQTNTIVIRLPSLGPSADAQDVGKLQEYWFVFEDYRLVRRQHVCCGQSPQFIDEVVY